MLGELLGSALIGLALALGALRFARERFPDGRLVVATGVVAGAFGGLLARTVLGPGNLLASLLLGGLVAAALLSLLLDADRPTGARPHP
ncbi:hypothetical protein GL263_23350, partial [Streptomyces durbertensis]